jgi:4-hydroxy-tetrahydrodipicolinate synthase
MSSKFRGVFSALVTPFWNGRVDFDSLEKLVSFQIENKITGFVVNGTTAESPTLSEIEVKDIFNFVKKLVPSTTPVILGTGSNNTEKTVAATVRAAELGADAALVVVPYYNKPPQRGLVSHFQKVAESTALPIILYNVPGRTITSMSIETIQQLTKARGVVGIKEASGDLIFDRSIKSQIGDNFTFLSGDDGTFIDFMRLGGHGIISVMSNLLTSECMHWFEQCANGRYDDAAYNFDSYRDLINGMYVEANPIPIKWMLKRKGLIRSAEMRLPLVELASQYQDQSESLMSGLGLL